ncbi:MAG TPA: hypothetical protein VKH37_03160, partial [Ferruginibacter sp.]|nr:hypothetical protein [Ferruginibacter sp.]
MGAANSNLSALGVDIVYALTQNTVQSYFGAFLNQLYTSNPPYGPVFTAYYVTDESGNLQSIGYSDLMLATNGTDPFNNTIPVNTTSSSGNAEFNNLVNAKYVCGFQGVVGLPSCDTSPSQLVFLRFQTSPATPILLNLLCYSLQMNNIDPKAGWEFYSQDASPLVATAAVNLINSDTPLASLPPVIQKQITGSLTGSFSIAALVFDLTQGNYVANPVNFAGVPASSFLYSALNDYFVDVYLSNLNTLAPTTAYIINNIQQPAPVNITSWDEAISPFINADNTPDITSELSTLNFVCDIDNDTLPSPLPAIGWNWVDSAAEGISGILSISREKFLNALLPKLLNCQMLFSNFSVEFIIPDWMFAWQYGYYYYFDCLPHQQMPYTIPSGFQPDNNGNILLASCDYTTTVLGQNNPYNKPGQLRVLFDYTVNVQVIMNGTLVTTTINIVLNTTLNDSVKEPVATSTASNNFLLTYTQVINIDEDGNLTLSVALLQPINH